MVMYSNGPVSVYKVRNSLVVYDIRDESRSTFLIGSSGRWQHVIEYCDKKANSEV